MSYRPSLIAQFVKNTPATGDHSLIPESGRSSGEGIGYPLQYSWASLMVQLVRNLPAMRETTVRSLDWEIPWRRERLSTPVFWPGEFHGLYGVAHGVAESDTTEWVLLHSQKYNEYSLIRISSVTQSCLTLCNPMNHSNARPPCPSRTPGVHPNPCPLSRWCHPTISSSVIPFSSCPQSFPASGSFPMSQLFASGGQSIGVAASKSVLPMNTKDWSPLGWTGWISLQSKGFSRVFSNTAVQKHQFFGTQLSL